MGGAASGIADLAGSAADGGRGPVLVTGAAGFVGSAVAARLAAMGQRVVGCDNFNDYYDPALKRHRAAALLEPAGVACQAVELSDAGQTAALFERVAPALVVHLAAQAGVRHSLQHPGAYVQANLVGFAHVLESCRRHRVAHLLYASSSSVYGASARTPFSEHDQTDAPLSLYAATKKANEVMAYSYSHLYGLPATGLRFFTVYGPWGRPDMAYFIFARKMLAGQHIPVFAEGKLLRDFTYIDDIVEGVVRLLFKPPPASNQPAHALFNIGHDQPVRVLDFIHALEHAFGVRAALDFQPMQPGDVPATHADTGKLQAWIGYKPGTSLEAGLAAFARWYELAVRENVSYLK
ncbi:NAD-dependent epimerase/dehydratase family protein [Massilia forsythiae]|uniref:NAD-dependent epimerase/dehydratase family protein n=2 Tax=Massilia forsythiae TaxID=2728020 RepID=A0A7Z2W1U7_9BURK|nr:NAD-dependent epimerase/dehydratase family protein [Massilia forsythiae]